MEYFWNFLMGSQKMPTPKHTLFYYNCNRCISKYEQIYMLGLVKFFARNLLSRYVFTSAKLRDETASTNCEKLLNLSPQFITVDVSKHLDEFNYQWNHFRFLLQLRDKTNIQRVSKRSQLYTKLKAGFCSWDFIDVKFSCKLPKEFFIFWTVQISLCYVCLGWEEFKPLPVCGILAFPASTTVKSHFFAVTIFSRFKTSRYHDFAILGSREVMVNIGPRED